MSHRGIQLVLERDGHGSVAVAMAEVVCRSLSSLVTWRKQNPQEPEDPHGHEAPAFCFKLRPPENSEHTKTVLKPERQSVLLDSSCTRGLVQIMQPELHHSLFFMHKFTS